MSRIDSNALVQAFRVATPSEAPGCFLTKLDLFFFKKSKTFGVEVYLMEVVNGEPDPEYIIGQSRVLKNADEVAISNDATAATTFTFTEPVYVEANKRYAFAVRPVNNNPDYQLWVGANGGVDVTTGRSVSSTPVSESSYFAKKSSELAEMMNEDIKYKLYRARFNTASTGEITLQKDNSEIFAVTDLALAPGVEGLQTGDVVYQLDENQRAILTSRATVLKFDAQAGVLYAIRSTGQFQANNKLMFIREAVEGNPYDSNSSWLGTGFLAQVMDFAYHSAVPKIGGLNLPQTALQWSLRGINRLNGTTYTFDTAATRVENGTETELTDATRYALSYSNERPLIPSGNSSSIVLQASFVSESDFLSPVIDLDHCSFIGAVNMINNSFANEDTNYGEGLCRYISRVVTLADGMEAEDLRVLVSAFRPPSATMKVYAKVWNDADDDTFDEKLWTEMVPAGVNSPSDPQNRDDFREYTFDIPSTAPASPTSRQAFKNGSGVITYRSTSGATHTTYKKYSIKVVLGVTDREAACNPPLLTDVRAIALQA